MSSVATATGALLANGLIRIGLPVRRRSAWAPFIYLAVIAMAEWTTVAANAAGGLTLHAAILLALLFHGARCRAYRERALLWALALAPLIRVLSLSLPLASFPVVYWYAIISVPAFIAIGVTGRVLGYSRQDLGLSMRVALVLHSSSTPTACTQPHSQQHLAARADPHCHHRFRRRTALPWTPSARRV